MKRTPAPPPISALYCGRRDAPFCLVVDRDKLRRESELRRELECWLLRRPGYASHASAQGAWINAPAKLRPFIRVHERTAP